MIPTKTVAYVVFWALLMVGAAAAYAQPAIDAALVPADEGSAEEAPTDDEEAVDEEATPSSSSHGGDASTESSGIEDAPSEPSGRSDSFDAQPTTPPESEGRGIDAPDAPLKAVMEPPMVHAMLEDNPGNLVIFDLGPIQLSLYGLIGVQVASYTGSDNLIQEGDVAEQEGFRLRYARVGLQGWAFDNVAFMVSMEAADLDARLLEAWLLYKPVDYLGVRLGAFKMPFSRFATLSASRGALSERPLTITAMAPFRQVGVTLEGEVGGGMLTYSAGVFNGLERNTNFYEGYIENPAFEGNRFNRISTAARLSVAPLGGVGKDAADLDGGATRLSVGASVLYNHGTSVRTTAWGADLHLKSHGFHMLLEYLSDLSEPTERPENTNTIPAQMERMGVVGEFGYMVVPRHLGLTVRAEWQDDDASVDNAGDVLTLIGGIAYYHYRHHFKVSVDYAHREELAGASRDNDTLWLSAHFAL